MSIKQIDAMNTDIASPCVRNCCLDNQDICIGCCRHIDEIMAWRHLDNKEKQSVLIQCQQRQKNMAN